MDKPSPWLFPEKVYAHYSVRLSYQVSEYLEEVYEPSECYILIKLDKERIRLLKLEVNVHTICNSLINAKLKLKMDNLFVMNDSEIVVYPPVSGTMSLHLTMKNLTEELPKVVIKVNKPFKVTH